MGLRFYFGGSGAGKSFRLYEEVIKESMENPEQLFFILVPDQFTMQVQKELIDCHPRKGIMNIDVLSFGRLTHRVFAEVGESGKLVLDDTGKSLILRRIAAGKEEELTAIGSKIRRMGYIHEVKSAISEFMQYGIDEKGMDKLVEYSRSRGALYYKLKDLQLLYREFSKEIQGKFVTTEGQMGLLADALGTSRMIRNSVVVLDGFTGFTPIQYTVLRKLLTLAREVRISILLGDKEDPYRIGKEQELFFLSKKTIGKLQEIAEEEGIEKREDVFLREKPVRRFGKNPVLAHLEQELFRYRNKTYQGVQDCVHILEADSPREEVRQTCIQIHRLIREKGFYYRDIAVVAGDLPSYADHIEEEFARFSLPCYLDMTRGISLNPFIEALRGALKVCLYNFKTEDMFRYLRSGFAGIEQEKVDRLENYVRGHGIRGKKKWSENFLWKDGDGDTYMERLEQINAIRIRAMDGLSPLLAGASKVEDHVKNLYNFILRMDAAAKLSRWSNRFAEEGDLVRSREYAQIYQKVMELLEQIYKLIGQEEITLREFADILDAGIGEIQVGTIPQNVDRILVGDMERTRLKEIKVLFFLGVNDGNIPGHAGSGGIISDLDREFLMEGNFDLSPTPRQKMGIQRLYLYMNMTKPEEELYLSYARIGSDGKSLRPSYLIPMMQNLFPDLKVVKGVSLEEQDVPESVEDGFAQLAVQLRSFAEGTRKDNTCFFSLLSTYLAREDYAKPLDALFQAAFYRYENSSLGRDLAALLYGTILSSSVSRLETYTACAYHYFLEYGLGLKEREEFKFEEVDLGTLYHGALEKFAVCLKERHLDWFTFTEKDRNEILDRIIEELGQNYGDSILYSSGKYQYVLIRLRRILQRTVTTLQAQLKRGSFQPEQFEVGFSRYENLEEVSVGLTEKEQLHLRGRIDRIDLSRDGEQIYVKIIDYKSGNKTMDLAAVYYGLQLQLVVYMNEAMRQVAKAEPDKKVIPAAMLYYRVTDPMIKLEEDSISQEMLDEKIRGELRMKGLVNEREEVIQRLDGAFEDASLVIPVSRDAKTGGLKKSSSSLPESRLRALSSYVDKKIHQIGVDILEGKIDRNPSIYDKDNACDFCGYKEVCGFHEDLPGCSSRHLKKLSQDEAMELMEKEGEEDGSFGI